MMHWMIDTGCWMLAHAWLIVGGVALLGAVLLIRRRRHKRPARWINLTGIQRLAAPAVIYDQATVDAIADASFMIGMLIGAVAVIAIGFLLMVLCLRGSGNRQRNGRGVS